MIHRYIDADATIKRIQTEVFPAINMAKRIEKIINKMPTIEERKTGKWIDEGQYADSHPHHVYCCSECGQHLLEIEMIYDYCPHCGARMVNVDD